MPVCLAAICDTKAIANLLKSFRKLASHPLHPDALRKTFEDQQCVPRVLWLRGTFRERLPESAVDVFRRRGIVQW